jgi:hypothetical protein
MTAELGSVTVQIVRRNAFDSLSQHKMLDALAQLCPALMWLAAWAYQAHSNLHVCGRSDATILSMRGVWQGDPLGPLLFAVTMQGTAAGMTAAFLILWDLAEPLNAAAGEAVAAELGIRHSPARLCAAGSAVGIPRFVREHPQQCAEEVWLLVDTLDRLKLRNTGSH